MSAERAGGGEVFRPRRFLAGTMAVAWLVWAATLVYLLQFENVPARIWLAAVFFTLFFTVSLAYYVRTAIYVDAAGVTYRGMVRTQRMSFAEIRNVHVLPGPVTVYAVRGRGHLLHFTSFFTHHR